MLDRGYAKFGEPPYADELPCTMPPPQITPSSSPRARACLGSKVSRLSMIFFGCPRGSIYQSPLIQVRTEIRVNIRDAHVTVPDYLISAEKERSAYE